MLFLYIAKKSRNNKNLAIKTSALRLKQLEAEREELDLDFGKEIMIMRFIQEKMQNDDQLKQRVMDLVEENDITYFTSVLNLK